MWITEDMLAEFVYITIASGLMQCEGCTLPLTDPDAAHTVVFCAHCHEVTIWHEGCSSDEVKTAAAESQRRVNWRWN